MSKNEPTPGGRRKKKTHARVWEIPHRAGPALWVCPRQDDQKMGREKSRSLARAAL